MSKIAIKNISNRMVGIIVPDLRTNRSILPGKTINLEKDNLEELLTYPGVTELFSKGYLKVVDIDEGIELGLIDENDVKTDESGKKIIEGTEDYEQIKTILENGTEFQLKKILSNANKYRQDMIATIASQSNGITLNKIQIIKDITGIDIQKVIRED